MNTLFSRTLLWFIGTVLLTFTAMAVVAALDVEPDEQRRPLFGMLVRTQLQEARHAWETGGPVALRDTLERFRAVTGETGALLDHRGRDLLTGDDRTDLLRQLRRRSGGPLFRPRSIAGRRSEDGKYFYVLPLQRGRVVRWFLQPEAHLTVLTVLILLSYAFARRLTAPVRQLQTAVECFGRGEFTQRVRSKRKDEFGDLARTFDRMADRIVELREAERRLLLDVSHELRSPLARLALAIELSRQDGDSEKHLDRIEKEAGRLNELVSELLQLTRAEGDRSRLRQEPVDVAALLDEITGNVHIEAEEHETRLVWKQRSPVTFQGDPELLHRAFENVIRNAVRYAPAGTTVDLELQSGHRDMTFAVRDYGPGVPEEQLSRIFDPFYRVQSDRSRGTGGVGLGLAIVRRAVELHGGTVEASNANPGLMVSIRLPLTSSAEA